jgi:phosphatidylserine/phosphatidylglycerophosphate/cardiolipin synthase-like enzyme
MKTILRLFAFVLLGLHPVLAQQLELVESFPVGTDFDQSDLRQTQTVWLEMIARAKTEILWQTFYLAHEKGKATEPVLAALREAAERGVRVDLLVDPKFYKTYPETLDQLAALPRIEVRQSSVGPWLGGVMHAKALFVDGQEGFIGSQNLDWRSLEHIRELGVHFSSPELTAEYVKAFRWEWEHAGDPSLPATLAQVNSAPVRIGDSTVLPTFSPNSLNAATAAGDEAEILKLLDGATDSVEVALLTYSPLDHAGENFYPDLDNALRRANVRGVKVRLLLSHWVEGKKGEDHLRSLDALDNVEIRACRIPLTEEGEIPFARVHHSKYLVCDSTTAWLGTSNWQEDYFRSSRNYGLVFLNGPIPERLHDLFEFDWQRSTALGRP